MGIECVRHSCQVEGRSTTLFCQAWHGRYRHARAYRSTRGGALNLFLREISHQGLHSLMYRDDLAIDEPMHAGIVMRRLKHELRQRSCTWACVLYPTYPSSWWCMNFSCLMTDSGHKSTRRCAEWTDVDSCTHTGAGSEQILRKSWVRAIKVPLLLTRLSGGPRLTDPR